MTYTPTVYAWPTACEPINTFFRAGGQAMQGGLLLGGAMTSNPEPGGRAELMMEFAVFATLEANKAASWLISRITNGAILTVPIHETVQLVDLTGLPGNTIPVQASAAKGAASFTLTMGSYGTVLEVGHVIGFAVDGYEFAHTIMAVGYAAGVGTVTVSPPLRRALTTSDVMKLRPSFTATCRNAGEVAAPFRSGRHTQLNPAQFVEALV